MLSESVLQQTVDTVEIGAKNVTPFPVTALLEHYCPASFASASNNGNAKVLCIERKERNKLYRSNLLKLKTSIFRASNAKSDWPTAAAAQL